MTQEQRAAEAVQDETREDGEENRPPLTRAEEHRVVAGVCGGLGRHLDIDPVVFRVVVAVLCLTGGLGLFLYGLAWLIVPTERPAGKNDRTELQRVLTGRVDGQSIGAVLLTVIGTGVFFSWMGSGDSLFPLLLLGAMIFFAVRYDPERRRRARGLGSPPRPGGPYDRPQGASGFAAPLDGTRPEASPLADWKTWREGFHSEWTARRAEFQEAVSLAKEDFSQAAERTAAARRAKEQHAEARAAGSVPEDLPPAGPSGYLWDPRHPDRNPYNGPGATAPPGAPTQPWWQRADLPAGDPMRKAPAGPPAPVRPAVRRHRSFLAPLGLLLSLGAASAVGATGGHARTTVLVSTVLATALLGLGLTMMLGAKFGRARVLAVPALVLTLALAALGNSPASIHSAFGDRFWAPADAASVQQQYGLGAGKVQLDLSSVNPGGGMVATRVEVGAGSVQVTLPTDVDIQLTVRSGAGDLTLPDGSHRGGLGTEQSVRLSAPQAPPSKGTIDLTIEIGLGNVKVVQG